MFTNYGYCFSAELYGKDNIEALRIDGIYDMLTSDIRGALVPIFYEKDEAKKVIHYLIYFILRKLWVMVMIFSTELYGKDNMKALFDSSYDIYLNLYQ